MESYMHFYQKESISIPVDKDPAKVNFDYPRNDPGIGGSEGLLAPFDSALTLSFGESHARRMKAYVFNGITSRTGYYYPYWRLNSCLDNIRMYFGSSTDSDGRTLSSPPRDKLGFNYDTYAHIPFGDDLAKTNVAGALRYKVMSTQAGHPFDNEPEWTLNTGIPVGSRFLSCAIRVYYPPTPKTLSVPNTSYVSLQASETGGMIKRDLIPSDLTRNEQELFYKDERADKGKQIVLTVTYTARQPDLDGDLGTLGDPLKYTTDAGGHFTDLAWIKEVSTRHIPPEGARIIWYEER
jgi:hypothetical protein